MSTRVCRVDQDGQPLLNRDGRLVTIKPTAWLDQNRPVEQMTWCPGQPMRIADWLVVEGGWIERPEVTTFNMYRPPRLLLGEAAKAEPWISHARRVYGEEDAAHIISWLAHRVQRPAEKINHALVLGGAQGIGKDTLLEPVKHAVGPWNFQDISPTHLLGRFNGLAKSVVLRISEARDLGEVDVGTDTAYCGFKTCEEGRLAWQGPTLARHLLRGADAHAGPGALRHDHVHSEVVASFLLEKED
jgi:hypothetical protein